MTRRGALDRVVDLAVAVPTCALVAARRAVPVATRLGALGSSQLLARVTNAVHERVDVAGEELLEDVPDISEADARNAPDDDLTATVDVSELAIVGYDDLAARQIVDRLDGLDAADLTRIETYEREHRSRSTILGKIAMLTG